MKTNKRKNNSSRRKSGRLQVITLCVSTSMVLVLLGSVVLSVLTAHNLTQYMRENFTVSLMLVDDVDNNQAKALCQTLQTRPYVSHVNFISREQTLKENTAELGVDPTEFAEENPFTNTIELQLKADYANSDSLKAIGEELKGNSKIQEVEYPKDLMDQVNSTLRKLSIIMLALAALLTFISFSLINNTVQLSIFARRFYIHTMKLVGASWSFIRWPFIKQALIVACISAVMADAVIGGVVYFLYTTYEQGIFDIMTIEVLAITGGAILLFGLLITTICAYISVNKYLRMTAGDLYKV